MLTEDWLFFDQYQFHQQKLILHRASMRYYKDALERNGYTIDYIQREQPENDIRKLIPALKEQGIQTVHYCDVYDDWLRRRLHAAAKKYSVELKEYTSPNFLNTKQDGDEYFNGRKTYFQTDFYIHQRKKFGILVEGNNKPQGGRWSFDDENRKKFPRTATAPELPHLQSNVYIEEALRYVKKHYANNPGTTDPPFKNAYYPVTHKQAQAWLMQFLKERFEDFGTYEDAIAKNENVLHHSVLSSSLNIGLLHPDEVINAAINFCVQNKTPLNSVEGFIRQIMGWREYIRIVYEREGRKQRTKNFWGFTRRIPYSFWTGNTGIEPVDNVINKLKNTGYSHHIERLMIMGNFMLLCEFDPDEVYRWFMEMYIDSYDWVMVPNTYGMTQFSDGGLMMTKPYISGSNYIMKMSDHKKGEWQQVWDGLFWRFMHVHRDFFESNPRLSMLLRTLDKMPEEKLRGHLMTAEIFLKALDEQE